MKPIIGVTCNHFMKSEGSDFDPVGFLLQESTNVSDDYTLAVERPGAVPVAMPFYEDPENIKEFVKLLDGLLITGGDDIGPYLFGEDLIKESCAINYKRDMQEYALIKYVLEETNIPVLGICRGHQMLNVCLGGTLEQDNKRHGFWHSCSANSGLRNLAHTVYFKEDSKIAKILGKTELVTNSYHHQNVLKLSDKLVCTGWTKDMEKGLPYDMVEVEELPGERFVMGVQWHPEFLPQIADHQKIYQAFVAECKKYAESK